MDWFADGIGNSYYSMFLSLILCGLIVRWFFRPKLNLPPGPMGLPLVGYLLFLGKDPCRTLDNLKKKYGNVISLYLGRTKVVVLGDYTAVEEAYSQTATTYRPPEIFGLLPDGFGISNSNGEEWIQQRRFVLKTMRDLGLGRTSWATLLEDEIRESVEEIENKNGQPLDFGEFIAPSVINNIASLLFGRRLPKGPVINSLSHSLDTMMEFFSVTSVSNYFPWLPNFLMKLGIGDFYKVLREMVFFNTFIKKEIEDHRKSQKDLDGNNFISQYLEVLEKKGNDENTTFTERNMVGNTQSVFVGASDTTKSSMTWLFLAMAKFPDIQEKVYAELLSNLGAEQMASWEDRLKFPYTYAVILESQRWKTLAPLGAARMASENIKICGYDVEKATVIVPNLWGVHNDSKYWPEPEKFIPERFLRNGGKEVNLKPDSFLPFSYGKRRCPGETVAMMEIFLYFTALTKRFIVRAPKGEQPKMEFVLGLTYQPVRQKLCFIPRH